MTVIAPIAPRACPLILVAEDEPDTAELLRHLLQRASFDVAVVSTGDAALEAVFERRPDLVLLDLRLPVTNGLEVCRLLKARSSTSSIPVIMLTALTSESDRVAGLEAGADDYITKPFSARELLARVRAALRRGHATPAEPVSHVYRGRHLTADFDAVAVRVDNRPVRLTRREFELLRYLVANRNRVVSRDRLLERVWGFNRAVETRSVDVHVGRLRGKLGPAGYQIETVVGLGYRFTE